MRKRRYARSAWCAGLKSIWLPALCVVIGLGAEPLLARASDSAPVAANSQIHRTWENYFGVTILPSGRAIIVGDKGLVMTSEDQGRHWSRTQLRRGIKLYDLYSVAFTADGSRGWLVGDGGTIFRSDDHGTTWTAQDSKQTAALLKVAVIDAQKACAVGEHGYVLCTSDGGATWNAQKMEDMVFFDVAFVNENDGWAVGEFSTIFRTSDGGKTWAVQTGGQRTISADPYFAIAFATPTDGLILGLNGDETTTVDGGKSWQAGKLAGETHSFYGAVPAPSANGGVYIGGQDGVTATVAQGKVDRTVTATSNSLTSLAFSPHFGVAVGLSGTIMLSDDNGQNWRSLNAADSAQTRAE